MYDSNLIAVDLSKEAFQVCVFDQFNQVISNKSLTRAQFVKYIVTQKKAVFAVEACGSSQYWVQKAKDNGHEAMILPTKQVAAYRQGQKTDANDALAIGIAARQPKIKTSGIKTIEQRCMQTDKRIQEHLSDQLTGTSNMIRGLLAEYGITFRKGESAFRNNVPAVLEDAENELPIAVRTSLNLAWQMWLTQHASLAESEGILKRKSKASALCQWFEELEGVGYKNAINYYIELGNCDHFESGRSASACIGVTPKQHSTGGKITLGSIGRCKGKGKMRSQLIVGCMSKVIALEHREPKTEKDRWLKDIIIRCGRGKAAVALANKNTRTVWAMVKYHKPYEVKMIIKPDPEDPVSRLLPEEMGGTFISNDNQQIQ